MIVGLCFDRACRSECNICYKLDTKGACSLMVGHLASNQFVGVRFLLSIKGVVDLNMSNIYWMFL